MTDLTAERVRELLDYDPETGVFTWRVDRRGTARVGTMAGRRNLQGYTEIRVDGRRYQAHRLAWLVIRGEWPIDELDHFNRERSDNRFANLRDASRSENMQNGNTRRDNTSGVRGVSWQKPHNKWRVQISVDGRIRHLGLFTSLGDATAARRAAELALHGAFAPAVGART